LLKNGNILIKNGKYKINSIFRHLDGSFNGSLDGIYQRFNGSGNGGIYLYSSR
jgi:hypothetical protein